MELNGCCLQLAILRIFPNTFSGNLFFNRWKSFSSYKKPGMEGAACLHTSYLHNGSYLRLCFWNQRYKPNGHNHREISKDVRRCQDMFKSHGVNDKNCTFGNWNLVGYQQYFDAA